jgi:signal transduction histidine kinase
LQLAWIERSPFEGVAKALALFLALNPPEQWAANATFRSALAAHESGDDVRAAVLLRKTIEAYPNAVGETGYDLRTFAELELVSLPGERSHELAQKICRRLVIEPTSLSRRLLERAVSLGAEGPRWRELFEQHERARAFYVALTETRSGVISLAGAELFPFIQRTDGGRWLIGIPGEQLARTLQNSVADHSLPEHFGVAITVDDRPFVNMAGQGKLLAQMTAPLPLATGEVPLTARVFLADPDGFFAHQRTRTIWFGALILISAVAVLAGFFTAWQAFRRQQQVSEMKTNFVSSVSHELRAPIAAVRLMAEELENQPSEEKMREYHRFIGQECRRLSALIENVLDVSRREQGGEDFEFAPTDVRALFEETAAIMQVFGAAKQIRIESTVHGGGAPVEADARALQRLLINLLDNAIKHSPPQAIIVAELEFRDADLILSVQDDGPGIPVAEQARIFERFYRVGSELRRETPGVGLGLSIVKYIAEGHGGCVSVRSGIGKGSRFVVTLPLTRSPLPAINGAFA